MYSLTMAIEITGYSRDRLIKACKRLGIQKLGHDYVIKDDNQLSSIIEEIESWKPGNPNFLKKK